VAPIKQLKLWAPQKAIMEMGPQPLLNMAGVGSGKTFIGIVKLLFLLDQYPGSRGAIVRQRFQQLKKTTALTLWKLLHKDNIARRNDNEGMLFLKNGSRIDLIHLDKPDSITNLKSMELNFAYVDQAEDISVEAWDTLYERLGRWSGATMRGGWPKDWPYVTQLGEPIPPRYLFASAYSPGYDHWLTSRFWEHGTERERYKAKGYIVVTGSTRDNLALSKEYVEDRLAQGDEYVRRFVDATDWGAKEGRIFQIDPQSIIEPTDELLQRLKRRMRLHRVLDHGEAAPSTCLWYATDEHENIFFYREYGKADALVSDHRAAIYEMSKEDGFNGPPAYYSNYADPTIFNKNRGRSVNSAPTYSVADEYSEKRIIDARTAIAWRPANNDEPMTINRVREYLRLDPRHRNPITGELRAPRAYFIRRTLNYPLGCHEVLTDIRAARRVEVGVMPDGSKLYGDDRDEKVRDHYLDGVRYAIGMRPALGKKTAAPPPEPGTIRLAEYEKLWDEDTDRQRAEFTKQFKGKHSFGY
jgi:hypothetical protein